MLIRELAIENFRKFRRPIRLAGFEDGLNLVCDQNEAGKSTALEALRAVLFERHGSRSDRIRSFRPHGDDVAPTVELTFEIGGKVWKLRKRFLQNASVELEGPNGRATGDEAEERLQALLGFSRASNRGADDDSRGALGLLWVEQGQSFVLGPPGQGARRTLEEVLAGEVGAVTGGQRTTTVLQALERNLADFQTPTGRPARRLLEAQETATAAAEEARLAKAELEQFDSVLDRLDSKRGEQRRLVRELEDPEQGERLVKLESDIDRARSAGQALRTAEALLREAAGERTRLEAREISRRELRDQLERAGKAAATSRQAAADHDAVLDSARKAEGEATVALEIARAALRSAEEHRLSAQRAKTARIRQRALAAAFARLEAAEKIAVELQARRDEVAAARMTPEASAQLQGLEQALAEAKAAATAGAAVLKVDLLQFAPQVRLNGAVVEGSARVFVTDIQTLEFDGIGSVAVLPPASGAPAQARLRAAEQDLAAFLADVCCADTMTARKAARVRVEAAQAASLLSAQLAASCPEDLELGIAAGLDPLRGALAAEERPSEITGDGTDRIDGNIDEAWQAARTAEHEAEGRRQAALETLQEAQLSNVRLAGQLERAAAEVSRLDDQLATELEALDDSALGAALADAKAAEAHAIVARDEARRAVEGLDEIVLVQRRDNLRKRRERLANDRLGLVSDIAQLEERAKTLGGIGPASRVAAAVELADAAAAAHARLKEEAEMLAMLVEAIREAQRAAARRFVAPITQRVAPFIGRLLPNASITFAEDLRPTLLLRGGSEEATDDLSKGTQEQLAVLTRIAFADLLIEKGKPASPVLDDALVFADDDRFDVMLEILAEAAERMQVIVLSCRTSAYRGLEASRITLA
ncbi:DNA repair exonuclease SbcCD ATPase subunit [Bradyrhizobium sp. Rc2d]|uniref:AAA family ATPase n=1 Tax=Bradyrhizobium sp. Rc2d TaxID=1855321 RepID=UPI00088082BD|nr:AAA family ATPase [Bradyrhizobium sp. Rc2d]SDH44005.1 DNA repair exonuclease SbcCD ATPase subunit [Bradyrhizobium sp. Rc2d]